MPDNLVNINDSIVSENVYFDFLPKEKSLLNTNTFKNETIGIVEHSEIRFDGSSIPFRLQSQGWISLLMLLQFFFYFYAFTRFRKFWSESVKDIFLVKERSGLFLDTSAKDSRHSIYLSILCAVNTAFLLYTFISHGHIYYENKSLTILLFIGIVFLFFLLKLGILEFLGFVFLGRSSSMDSFRNSFFVLTSMLGVFFYINVLFLIYSPFQHLNVLFKISFIFYGLFVFLIAYRLLKYFYVQIYSFFYLILYLCTLEILPIALLYVTLVKIVQIV